MHDNWQVKTCKIPGLKWGVKVAEEIRAARNTGTGRFNIIN
jgi:hypothetical protein